MAMEPTAQALSGVEKLVWLKRYSSYSKLVPLVLYLPFGLAIGVLRFFIFLHACLLSFLLPNGFPLKRLILRIMLTVTGLPISIQGMPTIDCKKKVVIANHVTNLDPFILALLNPMILTLETSTPHLNCTKGKLKTLELPGDKDHSEVVQHVNAKIRDINEPLLFFPERFKTNGRNGVLKFSTLPFDLDCPIQPVTIQAYRYLFDIHVSTHSSSIYEDLFWCFLTPMTIFKVRYLPVTEPKQDESKDEFMKRVQVNMARSLGVTASDLTAHDVQDYVKKQAAKETAPRAPRRPLPPRAPVQAPLQAPVASPPACQSGDAEVKVMLKQVKDVLPDVPDGCILADLRSTKDVDTTIANILDGRVDPSQYKDEPEKPLTSLTSNAGMLFKASSFAKLPKARQMSFQERKVAMLEAARLKYRIKHGL